MSSNTRTMARLRMWWSDRFTRRIERIRVHERRLGAEKLEHERIDRTCYSPTLRKEHKANFEYKTHSQRDSELRRLELKRLTQEEKRQHRDNRLRTRSEKPRRAVVAA